MSQLNFNIRAAETYGRQKPFNPRARPLNLASVLWTVFAVMAVAGATFAIVWFA